MTLPRTSLAQSSTENSDKTSKVSTNAGSSALFFAPLALLSFGLGGCRILSDTIKDSMHYEQKEIGVFGFSSCPLKVGVTHTVDEQVFFYSETVMLHFHSSEPIKGKLEIDYLDGKDPKSYSLSTKTAASDFKKIELDFRAQSIVFISESGTRHPIEKAGLWKINYQFR